MQGFCIFIIRYCTSTLRVQRTLRVNTLTATINNIQKHHSDPGRNVRTGVRMIWRGSERLECHSGCSGCRSCRSWWHSDYSKCHSCRSGWRSVRSMWHLEYSKWHPERSEWQIRWLEGGGNEKANSCHLSAFLFVWSFMNYSNHYRCCYDLCFW